MVELVKPRKLSEIDIGVAQSHAMVCIRPILLNYVSYLLNGISTILYPVKKRRIISCLLPLDTPTPQNARPPLPPSRFKTRKSNPK
jgi:hypothetical protein